MFINDFLFKFFMNKIVLYNNLNNLIKKKNNIWIFDLDDTWINTGFLYEKALNECADIIINYFGHKYRSFTKKEILKKINERDHNEVKKNGFTNLERFCNTIKNTYKNLCEKENIFYDSSVADTLYDTASVAIIPKNTTIDNSVLNFLGFMNKYVGRNNMYVVTAGPFDAQNKKMKYHNLYKYFHQNHFLNTTKGTKFDEIKQIVEKYPWRSKDEFIMVGDRINLDINPALKYGINAVYLNKKKGSIDKFMNNEQIINKNNVLVLNKLEDLLPYLDLVPYLI